MGRPVAAFQPASKSLEAAKAAPAMTAVVASFSMVAESMGASWLGGVVVPVRVRTLP